MRSTGALVAAAFVVAFAVTFAVAVPVLTWLAQWPTSPEPTPPAAAPTGVYRVVTVERAGAIVGTCRLVGHPEPAKLRAWPAMGSDEIRDDESVVVGEKNALGRCVVMLADVAAGKDWPPDMRVDERSLTLRIVNGRYDPHLAVVRKSTQLGVVNQIAHDINVHGFLSSSKSETIFNFSVEPGSKQVSIAEAFLDRLGVVYVTDDGRTHFTAWIHVVANPYFDVTRADATVGCAAGEFRIEAVPAGDHDLVCWHEPMDRRETLDGERFTGYALGPPTEIRRRVHVTAGETTAVHFDVEPHAGR